MKKTSLFIFFIFIFNLTSAQELKNEHQKLVNTFINCIQNKDFKKLKTLISYPLKRKYPLPEIKNEDEFIKRYKEIFDTSLTNEISNSNLKENWSTVGWRGIMLNRGTIWLDSNGKLSSINYHSEIEKTERINLIETERKTLHKSLIKFKQPILVLETEKYRIRIDELENHAYRYASWSINSKVNEKPDLIIMGGKRTNHGSGANHSYEFNNGNYKYTCVINILGTEFTPPANLFVYERGNEILAESAQVLKK